MPDIYVFLELEDGLLSDSSKKIISHSRFIADSLGALLIGFCFYDDPAFDEAFKFDIDKLITISRRGDLNFQEPIVKDVEILADLFKNKEAKIIICADGWISENVFARLSQKLAIGFVSSVTDLQYDATADNFYFTFESISGKMQSQGIFENPNFNIVSMDVKLMSKPAESYPREVSKEYFGD